MTGRKERICPLWPETAALIGSLLRSQPRGTDEPIFTNRFGQPLHASGVRLRLRQYVSSAERLHPHLREKHVTPSTFRHTAAVHLVAAGVDVIVIQSWLGHAHLETTFLYAQANVETKRQALEQVDGSARPGRPPRWKREPALLAWLDSLQWASSISRRIPWTRDRSVESRTPGARSRLTSGWIPRPARRDYDGRVANQAAVSCAVGCIAERRAAGRGSSRCARFGTWRNR